MGRHPSRRHVAPEDAPVGRRIRLRRRELGITQAELASPQYTKSFISQLESGYADPSLDTLRFLGRRLGLSLSGMAGDVLDLRLALADGLLAWAGDARRQGRQAAARRALSLLRDVLTAPATEHLAAVTEHLAAATEHLVAETALLEAELALDDGRPEIAARALADPALSTDRLGPRAAVHRAVAAGRLALARREAGAALAAFKSGTAPPRATLRFPDLSCRALIGMALSSAAMGDARLARRRLQSAIAAADRHRLPEMRGRALLRLAWVSVLEGDRPQALSHALDAAQLLHDSADHVGDTETERVLSQLLVDGGEVGDALARARRLVELQRRSDTPAREVEASIHLGHIALAAGDNDLALRSAEEAAALSEAADDPRLRARVAAVWGRALLAHGQTDEAVSKLTAAVDALSATDGGPELAAAASALADHYQSRGDMPQASRFAGVSRDAAARVSGGLETWPAHLSV